MKSTSVDFMIAFVMGCWLIGMAGAAYRIDRLEIKNDELQNSIEELSRSQCKMATPEQVLEAIQ